MKHEIRLILYLTLGFITLPISCKRDKDNPPPVMTIKAPVAKAGPDISVSLPLCTDKDGEAVLDGTASSGLDLSYHWENIGYSVSGATVLLNEDSAVASLKGIPAGENVFELTVRDRQGRISRDTTSIRATGPVKEYDFEISIGAPFKFMDNYEDYYGQLYDHTEIMGKANFSPFGEFNLSVFEVADTSNFFNNHETYISIHTGDYKVAIYGKCSVNFKNLIGQRGGLFSGLLLINGGSAAECDDNVLFSLAPLEVTGNLDVGAGSVDLRIKGRVYF